MQPWDMKVLKENGKINTQSKEINKDDKKKKAIHSEKMRYKNADEIYE